MPIRDTGDGRHNMPDLQAMPVAIYVLSFRDSFFFRTWFNAWTVLAREVLFIYEKETRM